MNAAPPIAMSASDQPEMAPQGRRSGMTVGKSRSGVRVAGSSVARSPCRRSACESSVVPMKLRSAAISFCREVSSAARISSDIFGSSSANC